MVSRWILWIAILSCSVAVSERGSLQAGEGHVRLELIGEARDSGLAFQQWLSVLSKARIKDVRIRAGEAADRVSME